MARSRRSTSRRRSQTTDADDGRRGAGSTGGFVGQVGLFETANGLPHGPAAIVLAIVAALVIYPVTRLIQWVARR